MNNVSWTFVFRIANIHILNNTWAVYCRWKWVSKWPTDLMLLFLCVCLRFTKRGLDGPVKAVMSLPVIEVAKNQWMDPMIEEILHWVGIWTLLFFNLTFHYLRVFITVKGNGNVSYHEQMWKSLWKCQSLNCVQLFATLWTAAHQTPLSMGLPRQQRYTVRKEKKKIQFGTFDSPTRTYVW